MPIAVRPPRADEGRIYLEIVNSAIRGLAVSHYPPDVIDGWVVAVTDETVRDLMLNSDHEIRLIAELDGKAVGIGALILERSELRACYMSHRHLLDRAMARHWFARSSDSRARTD
jgi:hypothetical protein